MFGMGFFEIFLVLLVAIVALGPEKLPSAVVDIAKFFKKFKSGIDDAKSTLDNELNISEMKKQADDFKESVGDVANLGKIDLNSLDLDDDDDKKPTKKKKSKKEKVSLAKEEA